MEGGKMVKPNVVSTTKVATKNKVVRGNDLISLLKSDKALQQKALQNTANKWAKKSGFKGDLSLLGVSETGKSFHLSVDGKPQINPYTQKNKKYAIVGTKESPMFVRINASMFNK